MGRIALLALVLAAASAAAGPASAASPWVALSRHGVPPESVGLPPAVGGAAHGVDAAGTLWLSVALEGAAPDALHEVYLVCGPTVAASCGYAPVGVLHTDAGGHAAPEAWPVSADVLALPPFGSSPRLNHISVLDPYGAAYISDPFAYDAP